VGQTLGCSRGGEAVVCGVQSVDVARTEAALAQDDAAALMRHVLLPQALHKAAAGLAGSS
jgi:ABC-type amino acid transport system permease subunit